MPFELKISSIHADDDEIAVTGRITSGAYAGPEWVTLSTTDGRELTTVVTHHSMYAVQQWPLTANHAGSITIHIRAPRQRLTFDRSNPVTGIGFRTTIEKRVDITASVDDPRFWAMHLRELLESDEVEDPAHEYFGLDRSAINEFYASAIEASWRSRSWPFIRVDVGTFGYAEVEYAADAEYQTRFWLGDRTGNRTILGYDSGHFSLPAIRMAEVTAIATAARGSSIAACLLLPGCRERAFSEQDQSTLSEMLAAIPGFSRAKAARATDSVIEACTQNDLFWLYDAENGWTNNSTYSQRNPRGPMTWLEAQNFQAIQDFFTACG